jgi:hypothetical protein
MALCPCRLPSVPFVPQANVSRSVEEDVPIPISKICLLVNLPSDLVDEKHATQILLLRISVKHIRGCIQKVSGLVAWSENFKWYSSLPLGAVCESV